MMVQMNFKNVCQRVQYERKIQNNFKTDWKGSLQWIFWLSIRKIKLQD